MTEVLVQRGGVGADGLVRQPNRGRDNRQSLPAHSVALWSELTAAHRHDAKSDEDVEQRIECGAGA